MKNRAWIVCRCCGKRGRHHGRGWRRACYDRWMNAGRPASGPPPAGRAAPGVLKSREIVAARSEDYLFLRTVRGLDRVDAAAQIGISARTALRYENRANAASCGEASR